MIKNRLIGYGLFTACILEAVILASQGRYALATALVVVGFIC